jgi:hypothetical protein
MTFFTTKLLIQLFVWIDFCVQNIYMTALFIEVRNVILIRFCEVTYAAQVKYLNIYNQITL